ncbi:MAG: hypothetical protein DRO01_08245 [Thermoproteota archaeon]|nr:MAG: hypothetical protein DRO01_08245 [Candidatus Korarchaeota archaeon]
MQSLQRFKLILVKKSIKAVLILRLLKFLVEQQFCQVALAMVLMVSPLFLPQELHFLMKVL